MKQTRIFVTRRIPEDAYETLRERCEIDAWQEPTPPSREELIRRSRRCEGLLTTLTETIDEAFLAECPHLRVVSNMAVGYNNIDVEAARKRGIAVGNTPGVLTDATADLALTLMLACSRRVKEALRTAENGEWHSWDPVGHLGLELSGATLGIVGMGRIGRRVAERAQAAWGMRILYHNRERAAECESALGACYRDFPSLVRESDVISVHTPLTPETHKLFGREAFTAMKPTAIFINTARGPIHDQTALYDALRNGELFAAGLDVTDPEPLPSDDVLYQLPNAIVLPHIGSATTKARGAMADIAARNLVAGLGGEPMPSRVV